MKIKKILIILVFLISITGCKSIKNYSYDEIVNTLKVSSSSPNVYRKGYKYYLPKGLSIKSANSNYVILNDINDNDYYMFVDLISYSNKLDIDYDNNDNYFYNKKINNNGKIGYIWIKNYKNNQYLIEIVYNYAKIEVMVDDKNLKNVLVNSINVLKSVVYDDIVIQSLLKSDNLTYTEENFDMFSKSSGKSSILDYNDGDFDTEVSDSVIKDTDLVN